MCMFVIFVIFCVSSQVRTFGDFEITTTEFYDGEPEVNKNCNEDDTTFKDGNLGQTGHFPWIGVLKVHYHKKAGVFQVAATCVVLVKNKYAIANADDIVKIPDRILKSDSKVTFIAEENNLREYKVKGVSIHPEYPESTFNTIALLELREIESKFNFKQICWPSLNLNTSNELYGIGFTDEHATLEKFLCKLQFIPKGVCREFFNRSNLLRNDLQEPVRYQCAFAPRLRRNCTWENGMVVATNASGGVWMLVGIMVRGLGCSSPARFLDFSQFVSWIDVTTSYGEDNTDDDN